MQDVRVALNRDQIDREDANGIWRIPVATQHPDELLLLFASEHLIEGSILPDGSQWAPKFWKFRVAPHTALRTSRVCRAQANPRGYASWIRITPILAFPSQASNALHGWLRASSARQFSPWHGHASCKHWQPRMRVPKTTW